MQNILISIGSFLGTFFKFLLLNTGITCICLVFYFIYVFIKDKITNKKLKILILIISLILDVSAFYMWYTLFGPFSIIAPILIIFFIILGYLMFITDN